MAIQISGNKCDEKSLEQAVSKYLVLCPIMIELTEEGWNYSESDASLKAWVVDLLRKGPSDINLLKKILIDQ